MLLAICAFVAGLIIGPVVWSWVFWSWVRNHIIGGL